MIVLVLRGKGHGKVVEIDQWCNDWFTNAKSADIYSPMQLAFSKEARDEIIAHKNNGLLFEWFTFVFNDDLKLWVFKKNGKTL